MGGSGVGKLYRRRLRIADCLAWVQQKLSGAKFSTKYAVDGSAGVHRTAHPKDLDHAYDNLRLQKQIAPGVFLSGKLTKEFYTYIRVSMSVAYAFPRSSYSM